MAFVSPAPVIVVHVVSVSALAAASTALSLDCHVQTTVDATPSLSVIAAAVKVEFVDAVPVMSPPVGKLLPILRVV